MKIKHISLKKGFTLVELMVVIAIIGILTAIVTTNFAQSKAKARDAKRISDLAQIQLTLELFFDRCNGYPVKLTSEVVNSITLPSCPSGINLGTFISKIPTPPTTSVNDLYVYYTDNNTSPLDYGLRAILETNSNVLLDSPKGTISNLKYNEGIFNMSFLSCSKNNIFYYCVVPK